MATVLSTAAVEESTYIVSATFTDEAGSEVIPVTTTWTLTDINGVVINSRQNVVITPAATIYIVLTGDDLPADSQPRERVLTVSATYNSIYGTGLKLKGAAVFNVENLVSI